MTGRFRYRSNWRGKLILQIEEEVADACDPTYGGGRLYKRWRDARLEDFPQNRLQP